MPTSQTNTSATRMSGIHAVMSVHSVISGDPAASAVQSEKPPQPTTSYLQMT